MKTLTCDRWENANWRNLYRAAILEHEPENMPARIASAKNAIVLRVKELFQNTGHDGPSDST